MSQKNLFENFNASQLDLVITRKRDGDPHLKIVDKTTGHADEYALNDLTDAIRLEMTKVGMHCGGYGENGGFSFSSTDLTYISRLDISAEEKKAKSDLKKSWGLLEFSDLLKDLPEGASLTDIDYNELFELVYFHAARWAEEKGIPRENFGYRFEVEIPKAEGAAPSL